MITIVLADDHAIVRQGLRAILENETEFSVVGEAEDGLRAIEMAENLQPDVLIADIMMPGLNGIEVARQLTQSSLKTRIVILSLHNTEVYILEALRHGATGYVLKDTSSDELIRCIHEVAAGRRYLSATITERAINAYVGRSQDAIADPYLKLTAREREVLLLVAEGCTTSTVATRLHISPRTVEVHRSNLMRKLGLTTQSELIRFALRRGLLALDD